MCPRSVSTLVIGNRHHVDQVLEALAEDTESRSAGLNRPGA